MTSPPPPPLYVEHVHPLRAGPATLTLPADVGADVGADEWAGLRAWVLARLGEAEKQAKDVQP